MRIIGASVSKDPDLNRLFGMWASMRIFGHSGGFEKYCSFGVVKDNQITGVVILHEMTPDTGVIEISAAGIGNWQSRRLINLVFDACFNALSCQMIVMRGNDDNEPMLENCRKLGFSGYHIPRLGGRDKGQWIFTLTDDDWRKSRLNRKGGWNGKVSAKAA